MHQPIAIAHHPIHLLSIKFQSADNQNDQMQQPRIAKLLGIIRLYDQAPFQNSPQMTTQIVPSRASRSPITRSPRLQSQIETQSLTHPYFLPQHSKNASISPLQFKPHTNPPTTTPEIQITSRQKTFKSKQKTRQPHAEHVIEQLTASRS